MDDQVMLVDSIICRLCAEDNVNGTSLFSNSENENDLSTTVNRYLPIKIRDDGKLPRTICPGCNIQLEAMVQFMELIIAGQKKLRELLQVQNEVQKTKEKSKKLLNESIFNSQLESFTIQAVEDDGNEILIQIMPDGSVYSAEHDLSLKVEGLLKPRRKRGRPPKLPPSPVDNDVKQEPSCPPEEDDMEIEDSDGRKRRRRKVPTRFLEAVQGKELERIFREEGVIDAESPSEEEEVEMPKVASQSESAAEDEVIGHLETVEGQDLGELVVSSKAMGPRRPKIKKRKRYECKLCRRGFVNRSTYILHAAYHKEARYECITCHHLFTSEEELTSHHTHTGHTAFPITELPDKQEDAEIEEELDEPLNESKYKCEQCDKQFSSKQNHEIHVKAIHEGQRPYACDKCDKSFAYVASLRGHMACHGEGPGGERGYMCDICDKVFNHPSSVGYHKEAEHNDGRRFVCNKCGKSFKHKQLLQRHQLVHTDERPYACRTCTATFKTRANLLNHMPTHTGVKKYFCQQCGQLFAHKTSLTLHYRWHSGQKPYECAVCRKAFSQKGNLQEHQRIHTGEKPYACAQCGRRFTTSSQHRLHVRRHTGERPWQCAQCGKAFLHKDTWKCHMRRHRDERPYRCAACPRTFTEQHALRKHLRTHTGERPYACDTCGKTFADCSNLAKHKKVHRAQPDSPQQLADGQVFYVTYDGSDGEQQVQTLVQVLEDEPDVETSEQLPLAPGHLQVQDEQGEPIYYTTHTGQRLRVSTYDGESLQVTTDNGTVIPIQLNVENGRPVAVALSPTPDPDNLSVKEMAVEHILTDKVEDNKENTEENNEVNNLMNHSMHFITEDGQNVCFVLEPDNVNAAYLSMT